MLRGAFKKNSHSCSGHWEAMVSNIETGGPGAFSGCCNFWLMAVFLEEPGMCIYAYYIYIYTYIYTPTHVYLYITVCMCVCIYMYVCVYMYIYLSTYLSIYLSIYRSDYQIYQTYLIYLIYLQSSTELWKWKKGSAPQLAKKVGDRNQDKQLARLRTFKKNNYGNSNFQILIL